MTQSNGHEHLRRFDELVSAYGARPEAWPEGERSWASAFMRASPEAQRLLAEAAEVDDWLDSLGAPPAQAGLEQQILAGAPAFAGEARRSIAERLFWRLREWQAAGLLVPRIPRTALAVVAAAVTGLVLGWGGVFSHAPLVGEEEEIVAMAFVGGGLERYELGEWQ